MNAVRKCHQYGLKKAIKLLIEENPTQYSQLTPSTLQYWVQILSPEVKALNASASTSSQSENSSQ